MITEISFDQIVPYWIKLWPWHTKETLQPHSNMLYTGGFFGLHYTPEVTYFAVIVDGDIAGVNSGHITTDNLYRSRGLWVDPTYRGNGFGVALLTASINKSIELGCDGSWSFPRDTSWKTYEAAGFNLTGDWIISENNVKNAYCFRKND